jgi:hypothetical protein
MKHLVHHPALRLGALVLLPIACSDDGTANPSTTGPDSSATPGSISATENPTTVTVTETGGTPTTTDPTNSGSGSQTGTEATTIGTDPSTSTTGPTSATDSTMPATMTETGSETTMGVSASSTGSTTDGTTGEPCVNFSCSDDNTQVLCDGELFEQCGNGNYCVDAACKPLSACEAAELFKSSEGCEYYAVKSELIAEAAGSCFAAFVANTGDQPVKLTVEYDGQLLNVASFTRIPQGQGQNIQYQPYDANAGLPVGEVAIMFLSRGPGGFPNCPAPAGIQAETHVVGTGLGKAFRISTDYPVAAYQMLPYGGGSVAATSATLMLPTSVWDINYIAINAYPKSQVVAAANPLFSVVAAEDGTEITLDPKVAVVGGNGVQGGPAGVPIKYTINRGQTLQFSQPQELTGSPLAANKPFGMFGGASCLSVAVNATACDGAHQQIPPVKALGNSYAAVRYRNRTNQEESPPWRLVGAVADTQLTWVPAKPAGAPDTLTLGQVAEFNSPGPFLVSSQDLDHPFYVGAYMTGGANFGGTGDPEWVNVIPTAQYLSEYVLFTDPTYPDTSLVVIRNKKDGVFADVNLTCAGTLGGWTALGDNQEWTRVDLVKGNFMDQGNCSNGRHEMDSDNPFGVTVWGWGSTASNPFNSIYVSYAYPAGAAIKSINDVVVLPQ